VEEIGLGMLELVLFERKWRLAMPDSDSKKRRGDRGNRNLIPAI
jgi:hypothetical protein